MEKKKVFPYYLQGFEPISRIEIAKERLRRLGRGAKKVGGKIKEEWDKPQPKKVKKRQEKEVRYYKGEYKRKRENVPGWFLRPDRTAINRALYGDFLSPIPRKRRRR